MKAWKIQLTPLSPFLIGAHRVLDNYFETLDYIPAKVLQAAFSRAILESHETYDVHIHGRQRRYYIDPDDPELTAAGCRPEWQSWFTHFHELYFNDATPMGAHPYTPSTFACKTDQEEHPLVESLPDRYRYRDKAGQGISGFTCRACQGRLERKDGWMLQGKRVYRRLLTRLQIDEKRLVSKDGHLYTLAVGEPFSHIDRDSGQAQPLYFESLLYAPEHVQGLDKATGEVVRVGAYITTGLGKMAVSVTPAPPVQEQTFRQDVKKWRELVRDRSIALQLLADLKYTGQWPQADRYVETEEYLAAYTEWLKAAAGLPAGCSVTYAYVNSHKKRGFPIGSHRYREQELSHYISLGSVLVLDGPEEEVEQWCFEAARYGLRFESDGQQRRIPVKILSGQIPDHGGGTHGEPAGQ